MYDYLIVGAGPFGCTFARRAIDAGAKVLVIDRRPHIAGNAFDRRVNGINVHHYGPHIFHTQSARVWEFVNRFAGFLPYQHRVKGRNGDRLFPVPINLMTMHQIWGVCTPAEAAAKLKDSVIPNSSPRNLEEWALANLGRDIYEMLIRGYTEKQWNRSCTDLPARILRRLPIRMNYDDRYFGDRYQGLPEKGYTELFAAMLRGNCESRLGIDFFEERTMLSRLARRIVYTGPIDRLCEYRFGHLAYRSLHFEDEGHIDLDFQGCPQMNFCGHDQPFTRIHEWKHYEQHAAPLNHTIITREFSIDWEPGKEPFYPLNDEPNNCLAQQYADDARNRFDYIIGGRLGKYRYYDMDQVIASALTAADKEGL